MGKASARQAGLKAVVIPYSFLNRDGLGGCVVRRVSIALMGTLCLIRPPTGGRGSESPVQSPKIETIRTDRLRSAHPTA